MYVLPNLLESTIDGTVNNVNIPFDGNITVNPRTLSKGVRLRLCALAEIVTAADVVNQRCHLVHFLDGVVLLDGYAEEATTMIVANSPLIYGLCIDLIIGNDGKLRQYGRSFTKTELVLADYFVGGSALELVTSAASAMGPKSAGITAAASGYSEQVLPFDTSVHHVFTLDARFTEVQADISVRLLNHWLEVYQGPNGNTAAQ